MSPTVVIIGGGYGGSAAAKALDEVADVVLVEPNEAFFHAVGALRATVDPEFLPQVFFPYDRLLTNGRVVHDRAVRVEPNLVTLASGEEMAADYIVVATGSSYPFPAKNDIADSASAQEKYRWAHDNLAQADHVLLLGAGPVGLEFAGEIKAAWPHKRVVIIDPVADILSEYEPELREEIRRQLAELDVQLVLGSALRENPPTAAGDSGTFHVSTVSDVAITADVWFRCFGVVPNTRFLVGALADARWQNGQVAVTDTLQVKGQDTVFALGDVTDLAESKRAGAAMRHADVVAGNIKALIAGEDKLSTYQPGPPAILLPLGPTGGAAQLPGHGVLGADVTAQHKGADLMTGRFGALFGTRTD
ncbi:NADH dehydrogenase FAD-containing subunit [Streptomyces sp. SAI-133]|uniref:NAD(P)/FAD-dependent oxidoreductase n=1 Tax=unclassified Streptomyces TaxID=2593676 RepID=UPI0024767045|nr:FAD-dependent oxidoreductase [Streptomyces sp. SAI-133]MDH6590035.1 NADH dehydrogenase FAD-containing subunit [Streptomyces sp. SAI-133]